MYFVLKISNLILIFILYYRRCDNYGQTTNTAKVNDQTTNDPTGGAVAEAATPLTAGQVVKGVTSTETTAEDVTMEVQIDDEIEEDDGERYSSYSMSSVEDENGDGSDGSRKTAVTKVTCDKDDIDHNFNTETNDHSCSSAVVDTTTSPPPDVIMHHNHDVIKRKGSRRSRRKRRSSTTATAVSDQDVPMAPMVGTVGEEEPLVPSQSLPAEINTTNIADTTITIESINKDNTNIEYNDDNIIAKTVDSNANDTSTTVVDTTSPKGNSDHQSTATTTLQSQQVWY